MDQEKARRIVFDPHTPAPMDVGFYEPTQVFLGLKEHIAVRDAKTGELHAITGPVGRDDAETFASLCEAVVFAGAFEMLELVKKAATGAPVQELAGEVLESLRNKMTGLQPVGIDPEKLRRAINHKLGLTRKEAVWLEM